MKTGGRVKRRMKDTADMGPAKHRFYELFLATVSLIGVVSPLPQFELHGEYLPSLHLVL